MVPAYFEWDCVGQPIANAKRDGKGEGESIELSVPRGAEEAEVGRRCGCKRATDADNTRDHDLYLFCSYVFVDS